jgi:hypothetical protein
MRSETMNPAEIRKLGLEVLVKTLGPVRMVRFLQQFETGVGDYTKQRARWLKDIDIEVIVKEIKRRRKAPHKIT